MFSSATSMNWDYILEWLFKLCGEIRFEGESRQREMVDDDVKSGVHSFVCIYLTWLVRSDNEAGSDGGKRGEMRVEGVQESRQRDIVGDDVKW